MELIQKIKDYLEETNSRDELINPETLLEQIDEWEIDEQGK
tara:strand:- start:560 stop:682 length:123 start_codon:yes stop_codon:yes gene_type:complete